MDIHSKAQNSQTNYFVISDWEPDLIKGTCEQMISEQEKCWRYVEPLEQQPFKRIAKYVRNKQYTKGSSDPNEIRTPQTLEISLKYLIDEVFILLKQNQQDLNQQDNEDEDIEVENVKQQKQKQKQKLMVKKIQKMNAYLSNPTKNNDIVIFLQETIKAIRCQYFVQGIICPSAILKIVKCMAILYTLVERPINLIGIQNLFDDRYINLVKNYPIQYKQAVKTCLLFCNKNQIERLVNENQIILEDLDLFTLFRAKVNIQNGSYYQYFNYLEEEKDPWIKCLLYSKIGEQREKLKRILIKSKMSTKKQWLYIRFGYKPEKDQNQDQWVNLSEEQSNPKKRKLIKYGYKNWISNNQLIEIIKN